MIDDLDPGEEAVQIEVEEVLGRNSKFRSPVRGARVALFHPARIKVGEGTTPMTRAPSPEEPAAEMRPMNPAVPSPAAFIGGFPGGNFSAGDDLRRVGGGEK